MKTETTAQVVQTPALHLAPGSNAYTTAADMALSLRHRMPVLCKQWVLDYFGAAPKTMHLELSLEPMDGAVSILLEGGSWMSMGGPVPRDSHHFPKDTAGLHFKAKRFLGEHLPSSLAETTELFITMHQ